MRPLARTFVVATLLLLPVTAAAQTLTIRDLVALNGAGLGDDVLIALIEADGTVFRLGPLDVLDLKKRGLSDSVLIKMIQTTRLATEPPASVPPRDSSAHSDDNYTPSSRTAAPPPVVVQQTVVQDVHVEAQRAQREREYVHVPVYVPVVVQPRKPEKEPEPVYWGFGGQRRSDSWQPSKTTPEKPKPAGGGGGI